MTGSQNDALMNVPDEGGQGDLSDKQMSLMSGVARPEGMSDPDEFDIDGLGSKRPKLSQGTMLILVVCVIAAGTLYGMRLSQRKVGSDRHSREVEKKIDEALAKIDAPSGLDKSSPLNSDRLNDLFKDTDDIVSMFAADTTQRQVPIQFIKKNPFVLPIYQAIEVAPVIDTAAAMNRAKQKLLEELQKEFESLHLQSVMGGDRPVAIIDGDLVQPGQSIGSFTVTSIEDLTVKLESSGQSFELGMEDESQDHSRSNRRPFRGSGRSR